MTVKYLAIDSTGVPFDTDEIRTVDVSAEWLSSGSGFAGDNITYRATIYDSATEAMPATFVAELMINGTQLASVAFEASVYDPISKVFTLPFTVPAAVGSFTVKLTSVDQVI